MEIGYPEVVIVLVIALAIFGPSKLPGLARSLGEAVRELRHATRAPAGSSPTGEAARTGSRVVEPCESQQSGIDRRLRAADPDAEQLATTTAWRTSPR